MVRDNDYSRSTHARDDGSVPLTTWLIGGAAFITVLAAGALFVSGKPDEGRDAETVLPETTEDAPSDSPDEILAPKNPLDITPFFLDASERSRIWSSKAMLAGIELLLVDGKPEGPVSFEFGQTLGPAVPRAPLSSKRQFISYLDGGVDEKVQDSTKMRVSLPDPTCPLEVAFRKLGESGVKTTSRVGVLYLHSDKHDRPVWLMTNDSGQATHVSAENCALLLR